MLIVSVGRSRGVLTAARALAARGWSVGVGTPDGGGMIGASKWVSSCHRVPRPRGNCEGFIEGVRGTIALGGYDLVFGGSDDWMAALAMYRDRVPAVIGHPDAAMVMTALDKIELAERANGSGLTAPRTVVADDAALADWTGPVVVKCRAHWQPGQLHKYRIESRVFDDIDDALDRIRLIRDAGLDPILQQPVEGELTALIGLMHDGRLTGRVQQTASRLWPTPSGVSSRAVTVDVDPELAARCERLLADLGWSGIVELQFLRDSSGTAYLIDFNGRFYGSLALALAAGVDLPDAWARLCLGEEIADLPDAPAGHRFSWVAGDVRRASVERRGGLLRDVASSLRWSRGAATCVWDAGDLGPIRYLTRQRIRSALVDTESGATV